MERFLFAFFFGCFHKKTTFPMTLSERGIDGEVIQVTYVTCLTCGEELAYNWDKMRIEGRLTRDFPLRMPAVAAPAPTRAWPILQPAAANHTGSIRNWQSKAEG